MLFSYVCGNSAPERSMSFMQLGVGARLALALGLVGLIWLVLWGLL